MKRYSANILFLVSLIFLALLFYFLSLSDLPQLERKLFPIIILVCAILFIFIDLIYIFKNRNNSVSASQFIKKDTLLKIFYMSIAIIVYLALLDNIGFFITSFLFMVFLFIMLGVKEKPKMILISVATLLSIYFIFILGLGLKFPSGMLF